MPTKPTSSPDSASGSEAAYLHYLPLAQKLPASEILPFRLDVRLAYFNLQKGMAALEADVPALRKALPLLDWKALLDLPRLGQALLFAASAAQPTRSAGELSKGLAEAAVLRGLLLDTAVALERGGVLPGPSVDRIRKGRGFIDSAQDLVDLAALYRKYPAALKQQGLVGADHLKRAAELGTDLLSKLRPARGKAAKAPGQKEALEVRDRLATLLLRGHQDLRRVAYFRYLEAAPNHVPHLQTAKSKRAKPTPVPAP